MTDDTLNPEAIRADMAAGTLGPWRVPDQTYRRNLTVETIDDELVACPGSGGAMSYTDEICTLGWSNTPEWGANARRIARLPDLERGYLDAIARADAAEAVAEQAKTLYRETLQRAVDAEAEAKIMRDRERHYAKKLGVVDGGQFRNDWNVKIDRLVSRAEAAEAEVARLQDVLDVDPWKVGFSHWKALRARVEDAEAAAYRAEARAKLAEEWRDSDKERAEAAEAKAELLEWMGYHHLPLEAALRNGEGE